MTRPFLTLFPGLKTALIGVQCLCGTDDEPRLRVLRSGQSVGIRGTCEEDKRGDVVLTDCRLQP
jgi:hypothetical protein